MSSLPAFDEATAITAARADSTGQHAAPEQHAAAEQPPAQQHRRPAPPPLLAALRSATDAITANPLIHAITTHPGMGHRLTDADIDAVLRVIASIESARIEVPTRYEQAAANRAAMQDGQ